MKKAIKTILFVLTGIIAMTSCDDTETYAEQKEREYGYINNFVNGNSNINKRPITVISETDFKAKGEVTDTAKNEYVLFSSTGIYMQIVDKGCGEQLKDGESADVLCRFTEYNINGDSLQLTNNNIFQYATLCDKMKVIKSGSTISATFAYGLLCNAYGSTSVPSGWLVPLNYVKLGRQQSADDKLARVRIIIPHDQGHAYATSNVYACFYDITYERGL